MNNFADFLAFGSMALALISSVAALAWFISSQFTHVRSLVYTTSKSVNDKIDEIYQNIIDKLEYHERHDDQRFASLSDDIWEIRVRNAAKDKAMAELESKHK